MNSQKGITLVSLSVYIIAMTIVVSVIAMISTYFYTNTYTLLDTINPLTEYTKFSSVFSNEVNHDNIKVLEWKDDSYIVFDNYVQYTYVKENKAIYRNKVKICRNVENCTFEHKIQNGKDIISVNITMDKGQEKRIDYTLKN